MGSQDRQPVGDLPPVLDRQGEVSDRRGGTIPTPKQEARAQALQGPGCQLEEIGSHEGENGP
ncbi:MAG: hypothetical protein O7B35_07970 [Deltaproteobacteria bacterium]|nr:hypothetical protein [Deltaproteobacteria bacterium]